MASSSSGPPNIKAVLKINSPHRGDPEDLPEVFERVIISNKSFLQSLIKMFYNLLSEGYKELAMELIDKATEEGDAPKVVVMTSVLEDYTKAGKATEALHLYRKMLDSEDCAPNAYTYNFLIKALAADPDPSFLGVAKECVMEMMGKTLQPSASTYTAVFEAYAGHEKMEEAKQFLEEMKINGFVADRKAMRAIRQLLKGKGHMLTSIMDILFSDLEDYSDDSDGDDIIKEVSKQIKQVIEDDPENPIHLERVFDIIYKARQIRDRSLLKSKLDNSDLDTTLPTKDQKTFKNNQDSTKEVVSRVSETVATSKIDTLVVDLGNTNSITGNFKSLACPRYGEKLMIKGIEESDDRKQINLPEKAMSTEPYDRKTPHALPGELVGGVDSYGDSVLDGRNDGCCNGKALTGTTTMGIIGAMVVYLATDQRGTLYNQYVAGDNYSKFYNIGQGILATMAGDLALCREMLNTAENVVNTAFDPSAFERIHLAALTAMAFINNWEICNPGKTCEVGTLISGWHNTEPIMYSVGPKQSEGGGIRCITLPGIVATSGNGGEHAKRFTNEYIVESDTDCEILIFWGIVAAALQAPHTGGHVQVGEVPRVGPYKLDCAFSVLEVVHLYYERFKHLMSDGFFMVANNLNYTPENDEQLREKLAEFLRFSQMHLISRENPDKLTMFLRFSDAQTAKDAFQDAKCGLFVDGLEEHSVYLEFYEPTKESLKMLCELYPTNPYL